MKYTWYLILMVVNGFVIMINTKGFRDWGLRLHYFDYIHQGPNSICHLPQMQRSVIEHFAVQIDLHADRELSTADVFFVIKPHICMCELCYTIHPIRIHDMFGIFNWEQIDRLTANQITYDWIYNMYLNEWTQILQNYTSHCCFRA